MLHLDLELDAPVVLGLFLAKPGQGAYSDDQMQVRRLSATAAAATRGRPTPWSLPGDPL